MFSRVNRNRIFSGAPDENTALKTVLARQLTAQDAGKHPFLVRSKRQNTFYMYIHHINNEMNGEAYQGWGYDEGKR